MSIVTAPAAWAQGRRRSALAALVYTQGECADEYTEIWYPAEPASRDATTAITVCFSCPVREACLELALRIDAGQHGIWGGLPENERRTLRKDQAHRLAEARRLDEADDRRRTPRHKAVA